MNECIRMMYSNTLPRFRQGLKNFEEKETYRHTGIKLKLYTPPTTTTSSSENVELKDDSSNKQQQQRTDFEDASAAASKLYEFEYSGAAKKIKDKNSKKTSPSK